MMRCLMGAAMVGVAVATHADELGHPPMILGKHRAGLHGNVLVIGSINVDMYVRTHAAVDDDGTPQAILYFAGGVPVDVTAVKGMTLPAASFTEHPDIAASLAIAGLKTTPGEEEAMLLMMDGPFEIKTGGKGANSAAAAGQSFRTEFVGQLGAMSEEYNFHLLADLKQFGNVDTERCAVLQGVSTGTAYIAQFEDNDNSVLLIGGANQQWVPGAALHDQLRSALDEAVVVLLQREIPAEANLAAARLAFERRVPIFADVGGSDAPLDVELMRYTSVIAPNESELTFISGVEVTDENGKVQKILVRKAVSTLHQKFADAGNPKVEVLVTMGKQGSIFFAFGWEWDWPAAEDEHGLLPYETYSANFGLTTETGKPKDTTGAGDCYRGSFAAARYGEGKGIHESMLWASAAASLATEVEGAMPAMPTRAMIQNRLDTMTAPTGVWSPVDPEATAPVAECPKRPHHPPVELTKEEWGVVYGEDRRRRLQQAALLEEQWHAEWRRSLKCWWIGLPMPTQAELGGCLGALGLHLGSRLDAAMRGKTSPTTTAAGPSVPARFPARCDWVSSPESAMEFPAVPSLDGVRFTVPPIPRLLPSWQLLQAMATPDGAPLIADATQQERRQRARGQQRPEAAAAPASARAALALAGGSGVAAGAAAALVLAGSYTMWRRRATGRRVAVRRLPAEAGSPISTL